MRYIFVTGGVSSSLGKGIAASSIAKILQAHGYKVKIRKFEPYLNVDPGTMSPFQHGEVFVTDDGAETDLDVGHYERFIDQTSTRNDVVTTGQIYSNVIAKERRGDYLGATIQVIPHITDYIQQCIMKDTDDVDFVLYEIGGTVGDIECQPFLEALRQFFHEHDIDEAHDNKKCMFVHLTLIPYLAAAKELKTKPTQHSVRMLQSIGIWPDILLCRTTMPLSDGMRKKIAIFCNVKYKNVIDALDVSSVYELPLYFRDQGVDKLICEHFKLDYDKSVQVLAKNMQPWQQFVDTQQQLSIGQTMHGDANKNNDTDVKIGLIGKYTSLNDAYKSIREALCHSSVACNTTITIDTINCEEMDSLFAITKDEEFLAAINSKLGHLHGIIVPGGYGYRGAFGKMAAIRYCRLTNTPFLGICYGMQLAVIEFARNVLQINNAGSIEWLRDNANLDVEPVVGLIDKSGQVGNLGGTMRLGTYKCELDANSGVYQIFNGQQYIYQRHRHRYEVDHRLKQQLSDHGMAISAYNATTADQSTAKSSAKVILPEIIEIPQHRWFYGVQFHPEFTSRPLKPHELFNGLVTDSRDVLIAQQQK